MDAFQPLVSHLSYNMGKEVKGVSPILFLAMLVIVLAVLSLSKKDHPKE